ncbi:A24 family peptidase [Allopusillimonas ginsengisoli]|uniref:A24 family peptidase n=1 Tax=Allopusillimonas ginsengisoli TaxID=453575 RepID=UPI00101EBD6D|nr:prepilin peptidase [Allopusillimonas ginsengisoli]TEA80191.1 peptidase [Allopusillimonas ginsengisoli]
MISSAWFAIFILLNVIIAACDFRHRRIPNMALVTLLAIQALVLLAQVYWPPQTTYLTTNWRNALSGLFIGLIVFFPLWRFRAMGAGDVKFIAVLGFCLGPAALFSAIIIGSFLAGIHALAAVILNGWAGAHAIWRQAPDIRRGIPYAAYVAIGCLLGLVWLFSNPRPWLPSMLGI